jgi:hypothetical protein
MLNLSKGLLLSLIGLKAAPWIAEEEDFETVTRAREFNGIGYVVALVLAIYVVGFYVAIPVYVFASIASLGRQPLAVAALVTVPTFVAIYVVFNLILEYPLFRGVLLS